MTELVACRCNLCKKEFRNFGNCQAHVRKKHGDDQGKIVSVDCEVIHNVDDWRLYKAQL